MSNSPPLESPIDSLTDLFMPEERNQGLNLYHGNAVSISSATDTQASAYLKASGSPRVSLTSEDIASPTLHAHCSCTKGKKGRLCRHIWAAILELDNSGSDLLASKSQIEMAPAKPESAATIAAKTRQAEFHKLRKEQNKARNKKIRLDKKKSSKCTSAIYPEKVEVARAYFLDNGFELSHPMQLEDLDSARKILARVFHPDKGGTHEEILTLNNHHEVIANYLQD